jgi:insertion element IS1 protein InsB
MKVACNRCGKSEWVNRAGRNRSGTQRYRCHNCQQYFTPDPKPQGCDPQTRHLAVKLSLEGMSNRAIGRVLSVHNQSVANWLEREHAKLPPKVADDSPTDYIESDELFTFVEAKKNQSTS